MPGSSCSLRVTDDGALALRPEREGFSRQKLSWRYVAEGLRVDAHPAIVFRAGPRAGVLRWRPAPTSGRSSRLPRGVAGQAPAGALQRAAEWLGLFPTLVQTAIAYDAEHRDEIELLIGQRRGAFGGAHGAP